VIEKQLHATPELDQTFGILNAVILTNII